MFRAFAVASLVLAVPAAAFAADGLPATYLGRPLAWVPKLSAPAKLAGDLSAPEWKNAAALKLVDPVTGAPAKFETTAFLFATDAALYVGVRCAEPRPDALVLTKNEFWMRDEVEIFLEPRSDTLLKPYHQIAIDAAGRTSCNRWHVYKRWFEEHALEEKWTPKVEVAAAKGADFWSVEARIPFDQLVMGGPAGGASPARATNLIWRLNVGRVRPDRPGDPGESSLWSPTGAIGFQWPTKFGYALVEPFATSELIDAMKRMPPPPPDPSLALSTHPAVLAAIDEAFAGMISPDAAARARSAEVLKAFAQEGPALFDVLQRKADAATAKARAERNPQRAYMREVSSYLLASWRPDEDPPPASVLAKVALFEPRQVGLSDGRTLGYRLLRPLRYDPAKSYPLLVWLHGSAESGSDNRRQLFGGAWNYIADDFRAKRPCFVLAPQCPIASGWADTFSTPESQAVARATSNYRLAENPSPVTQGLLDVIESLWKEFPSIDRRRIYVSGASMGGFGTYELIMRRPDWFAAAMPLCGGGDETQAARIARMPIWIFHGEKDEAVKVTASRNMVEALKAAGGSPRYTEVPGAPHAMGQPNLKAESLDWLFSQRRDTPAGNAEPKDHAEGGPAMPKAPMGPICQSCAMPMQKADQFGTNADGRANAEYCAFCGDAPHARGASP